MQVIFDALYCLRLSPGIYQAAECLHHVHCYVSASNTGVDNWAYQQVIGIDITMEDFVPEIKCSMPYSNEQLVQPLRTSIK